MSLTWRDVAPPEASASNQMYSKGIDTVLGGFDKFKGVVDANDLLKKKKEEEDQALLLGQLQAATAGQGASEDIKAILGAGIANGLGGAQLSALASGAVAQGKNLFDQGIDKDKLAAQNAQFTESLKQRDTQHKDTLAIQQGQLSNQEKATGADIAINNAKLALQKDELKQKAGESDKDYQLRLKQVDGTINNNAAEIELKQGEINAKALLAKQTSDLMNSPEFIAATPQQKQEALASLAPDAETAAKVINAAIPKDGEGGKDNKGGSMNVNDSMKYFENPEANVAVSDQIKIRGLMEQAKEAGIPPSAVASYMAAKSDIGGFFDQNLWGSSDMESDVLLGEINKYALDNGWTTKGSKVDASAILPKDMPIPGAKQK